jgi:hypothetical protein
MSERTSRAAVDPLYVAARSVLLDALTALQPHGLSVIVAGAQAIYLRTGEANLAIAPYTTDGDLAPDDQRSIQAEVAGLAALLVAKLHKLHERVESQRPARIDDKDAADVLRIMQTTDPADIAVTLATLTRNPIAGEPTTAALTYLDALFGTRGRPGIAMAQRSLRTAMPADRVQTICVSYTAAIQQQG